MANNFQANASTVVSGPTLSMTDVAGTSYPTTGLASNVVLYVGVTSGTQPAVCTKANPLYSSITDGTNVLPTMDAAGRPGFQKITDGTNTMPTMDAAARKGFVSVTDGTNTMPTGDALARAVNVKIGDGTTAATVDTSCGALKVTEVGGGTPLGVGASVSAATNNQTLSATASKTTHCTGFMLTGLGATAASNISVTLSDGTWTLPFSVPIPAGATVPMTPFFVPFSNPIAASATNTTIVLTVPSYGAGNTAAVATIWGYKV